MSPENKYRILPLGFTLFVISIVILLFGASAFARSYSAPNKLLYLINKQVDEDKYTFDATLDVTSIGDNTSKDFILNSEISLDEKKEKLQATNELVINKKVVSPFITILSNDFLLFKDTKSDEWAKLKFEDLHLLFKDNSNLDLDFEKLIEILDLQDPKLRDILSSNLISIKSNFNENIQYANENKNEIIVTCSIEDLFGKTEYVINDFLKNKNFEDAVMSRISKIYNLYSKNSIIEYFDLNTTVMFSNLVQWNNNFEDTLLNRLDDYKKTFFNEFKDTSEIQIIFKTDNSKIVSTEINALLYYNSSESYKKIHLLINNIKYDKITDFDELNILDFKDNHSFYNEILNSIK